MLALCSMLVLTAVYGGVLAGRAFPPMLAESLAWRTHAGEDAPRSEVSLRGAPAVLHATLAATDKEALLQLFDDINKWDAAAQEELVRSGRVFAVDEGTAVRVLSRHAAAEPLRVMGKEYEGRLLRVRILEGEYTGETIWVPLEWVEESTL
jgi:hypothetical protein